MAPTTLRSVTVAELQDLAADAGYADAAVSLCAAARLAATTTRDALGASRLGGLPDLPVDIAWPHWNCRDADEARLERVGRALDPGNRTTGKFREKLTENLKELRSRGVRENAPLAFIAQLDLGDFVDTPHLLPLPADGYLWFFYDVDHQPWGTVPTDRGAFAVFYAGPGRHLKTRQPPQELRPEHVFEPTRVYGVPTVTIPAPTETFQLEFGEWFDRTLESMQPGPRHQLGGHAYEIQGDMRGDCALATRSDTREASLSQADTGWLPTEILRWKLLLQLTSDDSFIGTLREIDVAADLANSGNWITRTIKSAKPSRKIAAYWFGLFNPITDENEPTCDMYICGAEGFDEDEDDWASSPAYWPRTRRAYSAACAAIYKAAYEPEGPGVQGEYLCLWYSCLVVSLLCRDYFQLLLRDRGERYVAAGFDSGDCVLLGKLTPAGFIPILYRSVRIAEPTPNPTQYYELKLVDRDVWTLAEPSAPTDEKVHLEIGETWPADATFHSRIDNEYPGEAADLSLAGSRLPVASRRFAEIVAELDGNAIQYVPLQIDGIDAPYVLMNVVRELPCSLHYDLSFFKVLAVIFRPSKAESILGRPQQS